MINLLLSIIVNFGRAYITPSKHSALPPPSPADSSVMPDTSPDEVALLALIDSILRTNSNCGVSTIHVNNHPIMSSIDFKIWVENDATISDDEILEKILCDKSVRCSIDDGKYGLTYHSTHDLCELGETQYLRQFDAKNKDNAYLAHSKSGTPTFESHVSYYAASVKRGHVSR